MRFIKKYKTLLIKTYTIGGNMRVRKKKWARPELERANFVITDSLEDLNKYKGNWSKEFNNTYPIYLELGCGTGKFITENAIINPDKNFIGIDLKDEILVYAKRTVEEASLVNKSIENVRLIPMEIDFITNIFDKDEISRIYINFCNPWPKRGQHRRRLTHINFLDKYKSFLKLNSEIWFKTDDRGLFEDSIKYFQSSGFTIKYHSYDLHKSDFEGNVRTEYEEKFTSKGMPIMFLLAEYKG